MRIEPGVRPGWRRLALACLLLAGSSVTLACGDRIAQRGGQMNDDQGEMNFELVQRAPGVVVFYLEDHGQPASIKGATAVVEVKRDSSGWSSKLRADGANRFAVSLPTALLRGDSVTVNVSFPNGSIAKAHFTFGVEPKPRRPSYSFTAAVAPRAP